MGIESPMKRSLPRRELGSEWFGQPSVIGRVQRLVAPVDDRDDGRCLRCGGKEQRGHEGQFAGIVLGMIGRNDENHVPTRSFVPKAGDCAFFGNFVK